MDNVIYYLYTVLESEKACVKFQSLTTSLEEQVFYTAYHCSIEIKVIEAK